MAPRSPNICRDSVPASGTRPLRGAEQSLATDGNEPRHEMVFLSTSDPSLAWDQLQILILEDDHGPESPGLNLTRSEDRSPSAFHCAVNHQIAPQRQ